MLVEKKFPCLKNMEDFNLCMSVVLCLHIYNPYCLMRLMYFMHRGLFIDRGLPSKLSQPLGIVSHRLIPLVFRVEQ